jgi:hypothetical protein
MCGCPVFPEAFVEGNLDDASSYILLPQHCFGSLGSSLVPYEFWDFFPCFLKNAIGIFIEIALIYRPLSVQLLF